MGAYWLTDLPDVVGDAGLKFRLWEGWQTRSRSSGGYDQVWAIFCHHTASSAQPNNDAGYMWDTAQDRPIGAILLERDGRVTIGAAGATNCQGKGGPYQTSHGTIPLDKGNAYGIAIEAANNGVGEQWPFPQSDAYVVLVAALCDAYGLDPDHDVVSHFEWTDRKIDPAGPSPWAGGSDSWDMAAFRSDVVASAGPPPEPTPPPNVEETMKRYLARLDTNANHNRVGDGIRAEVLRSKEVSALKSRFDTGSWPGLEPCYYNPHNGAKILAWADVPVLNESQLDLDVGYLSGASDRDEG